MAKKTPNDRISLAGLDFDSAIRAALATGTMPVEPKRKGGKSKSPITKPKRKPKGKK
jgi:hypothetical protein